MIKVVQQIQKFWQALALPRTKSAIQVMGIPMKNRLFKNILKLKSICCPVLLLRCWEINGGFPIHIKMILWFSR